MGSIVSVHCAMLCILCTYCAMLYIHILCTLAHSGTLGWLGGIMVSSTQTHPSRQFNFTLTNTPLDALCSRQKEYTMHMLLVECGDKYSAGQTVLSIKGSAYGVLAFSTMSQWWVGVCKGERNNRLFQKANSDLIQFSLRTRIEHLKLAEILTVHWKWKLRNQAALKARFAKGSSLQNQQHCGKSLIKFPKAENIYALNSLQVVQTLCCCADSSEVGTFESATKF